MNKYLSIHEAARDILETYASHIPIESKFSQSILKKNLVDFFWLHIAHFRVTSSAENVRVGSLITRSKSRIKWPAIALM